MIKDTAIYSALQETPDALIMLMYNDARSEYHGLRTCATFTARDFNPATQPFYFDHMERRPEIDCYAGPVIILQEADDLRSHTAQW